MEFDYQGISDQIISLAVEYGPKLLGAIVVLIIGSWVIKLATKGFGKALDNKYTDGNLAPFLKGIFKTTLRALLYISVLGMIGIEMTSFIAILGAAGLAVGLALSGTLQNFAGSVIILLFKPYKVGDFIEAQGFSGSVKEIQIFNTILTTPDNKTIILPNGGMSSSNLTNYSTQPTRRVDWTFGIAYGEDSDTAIKVLKDLCNADERIHQDPEPFVALSALADSSVNFVVRAWVNAEDYWGVHFDMNKKVYDEFEKHGLSFPYPQMDVHLHKAD
jgi:small conductance mechanosensitive channel